MMFDTISQWVSEVARKQSRQLVLHESAVLISDVGLKRDENQDRIAALHFALGAHQFACIAVSDGMGGMLSGGDCATATIAALFASLIENAKLRGTERLLRATADANERVYAKWRGKGGATLSAVLIEANGELHCSNIGDSRIYVVEENKKAVRRVTKDDSLEEAFGGHGRDLVQYIGIGKALLTRVNRLSNKLDSIFITSDGAHFFDQRLFEDVIINAGDPARASDRIIALARWLGGPDNASIAAFRPADILSSIPTPNVMWPQMWAGGSQLGFAFEQAFAGSSDPFAKTNTDPAGGHSQRQQSPTEEKKQRLKRKLRVPRKKSQEQQLEIDISLNEKDDASDS